MAIVVFDPDEWRERFPVISNIRTSLISDAVLQQAFDVACLIIENKENSQIPYYPDNNIFDRKTLLYLLVCHLVTLALWQRWGINGVPTSATEGTVSAGLSVGVFAGNPNGAFFNQTPCGQVLWLALARYRVGGRYIDHASRWHPWG